MNRWVLLLRGVNVGGHGTLPMVSLRDLMERLGLRNVSTYIQSGNAVFTGIIDAGGLETILEDEIERHHGFRPQALILSSENFCAAQAGFPFPEAEPKSGHVWFLTHPAIAPNLTKIAAMAAPDERYALTERAFYLYAPEGIGRSKLAAAIERLLGVPATARNLATVNALAGMLDALPRE